MSKLEIISQSAGVKFPQRPHDNPNPQATQHVDKPPTPPNKQPAAPQSATNAPEAQVHAVPESRYNFCKFV